VDEAFIRAAIQQADLNALRIALYQATEDEVLARMSVEITDPVKGGGKSAYVLNPEHHAEVEAKALAYLTGMVRDRKIETVPDDDELRRLISLLTGGAVSDDHFGYLRRLVALDEVPGEVRWTGTRPAAADQFEVAIIGAGFSGVAAGVQLARLGIPFTIYERRDELGGTWSINRYPDARVDTTIIVYSYSFERDYPWSEYFARHDEVRSYIEYVAKKYGVHDHIRFGCDVQSATFDEATHRWDLQIEADGQTLTASPNLLIAASGLFANPRTLDVEGLANFAGEVVHTSRWTPATDVRGKRVAVIGNGSSGVQLLARVAEQAAHTTVYQRTPQWITPRQRYGDPISEQTRWLIDTMPYYYRWYVFQTGINGLNMQLLQENDPEFSRATGGINPATEAMRSGLLDYINQQLEGRPDLIEKVTPSYAPGARRLIVDNGWYQALRRDDVELVPEKVVRFTPGGIVAADGVERPADLVIAAIGFSVEKYAWPMEIRGTGHQTLHEVWADPASRGPRAHLSMTVPGFPNFFLMYGPNGQPRAASLPHWGELWASYIAQAAVRMIELGLSKMEVRPEVFRDYNDRLDDAESALVWLAEGTGREANYYVNEYGRLQVNAPWRVHIHHEYLERLRADEYSWSALPARKRA